MAEAKRRLSYSYNEVSRELEAALGLSDLGDQIWRRAWPEEKRVIEQTIITEQMITNALANVLDVNCHQDGATALRMQQAMLASCPELVQQYYSERLLRVVRMPRGRLAPDLMLDGRDYDPLPPIPNVFFGENKWNADWNPPLATHLYGKPVDSEYDLMVMWGIGHDDPSGQRVPHIYGTREDCYAFYHCPVGGGLYVASAVQIDVYIAYAGEVLDSLGLASPHDVPLQVHGLLVDAWAREVNTEIAVTADKWATVSYADLLAGAFEALNACDPRSVAADFLKVLLAVLLWLYP